MLAALPVASLAGAFDAEEHAAAQHAGLTLRVQYPKRALYREDQRLELEVETRSPCARAVIDGLAGYLAWFEDVRAVPAPASVQRLYDGPLSPDTPVHMYVQVRPRRTGIARGQLSLACDQRQGPRLSLATLIFP